MAKRTKKQASFHLTAKPRRVTIPSGHDYALFAEGQKVYVITADGTMPDELAKKIDFYKKQSYELGYKKALDYMEMEEKKNKANSEARMETPEEILQKLLPAISAQHQNDQNHIVAILLNKLAKQKERNMDNLQKQYDHVEECLSLAKSNYDGFNKIRNGGFDDLNFR